MARRQVLSPCCAQHHTDGPLEEPNINPELLTPSSVSLQGWYQADEQDINPQQDLLNTVLLYPQQKAFSFFVTNLVGFSISLTKH